MVAELAGAADAGAGAGAGAAGFAAAAATGTAQISGCSGTTGTFRGALFPPGDADDSRASPDAAAAANANKASLAEGLGFLSCSNGLESRGLRSFPSNP